MTGTAATPAGRLGGATPAGIAPAAPRPAPSWPVALLPPLLAPAAVLLAAHAPGRVLLPLLATLAVYPCMALLILRGRRAAAAGATLLWAASLSASIIVLARHRPEAMGERIAYGPSYREEMFGFIRTGAGRESDPARFLPQHALHLAAFALAAAVSGGLLGIAMGSILVGYMSYYVGALAAAGGDPLAAYLLGWPPWAILRVIAFVARRPLAFPGRRSWLLTAAALLILDAGLKWLLAPAWAALLRRCLGA